MSGSPSKNPDNEFSASFIVAVISVSACSSVGS